MLRLGVGRLIARGRVPYFRAALLGMIPVECKNLVVNGMRAAIAISRDFVLYFDADLIAKLDDEEMAFALMHELFHPLNKHYERGAGHPPVKVNIAGDLAINQIVKAMNFRPLPGVLFPEQYGFPEGLGMEGYLALLPDDVKSPDEGGDGGETGEGEQKEGKGGSSSGEKQKTGAGGGAGGKKRPKIPGLGRGNCGSGAGNPMEGEPESGKGDGPAGRSPSEVESIRRRVAEAVQEEAAKGRGTVPGELVRWAGEVLTPPKIPWTQKLATICRHAVAFRPGAVDYHYSGISRRQAAIGFGVGKPILPALRSPRPRVAFLMDTSGSMGTDECRRGIAEGHGVMDALGADMTFLANDAALHVVKRVRDWRELPKLLVGGGGTDLRPAFAAIDVMFPRPEVVVCVTDGQVGDGIPSASPTGMTVIFVLVGAHRVRPCAWGEHIEVDE
jgi:predicted metal-dependent peptidase